MRPSHEPLYTRGFLGVLAAEAAQVPALASEIGRVFAPDLARLFSVVLFVGVFCAGSAVLS